MTRERYLIIRIDHRIVPAIVEYATSDPRRWTAFRSSADEYSNKRDAIRDAKRLQTIWPGQYKVCPVHDPFRSARPVYDSQEG